jgi:hypothetical protein
MPPQGIIDLIQAKTMSIFTLLDEECRMPKVGEELGDMVDPPKPGIMVYFRGIIRGIISKWLFMSGW